MTDALAPGLLLAMPDLVDPNFRGSVVLLLHHDAEGSFGLVLNRELDLSAEELCGSLEMPWRGDEETRVHWGGPVQPDHGWLLLGERGPADEDVSVVAEGLRFSASPDVLRAVAADPPDRMRIFLGYAGWGPGQLAQELAHGSWLAAPISPPLLFGTAPERLWEASLAELGIHPATLVSSTGVN